MILEIKQTGEDPKSLRSLLIQVSAVVPPLIATGSPGDSITILEQQICACQDDLILCVNDMNSSSLLEQRLQESLRRPRLPWTKISSTVSEGESAGTVSS